MKMIGLLTLLVTGLAVVGCGEPSSPVFLDYGTDESSIPDRAWRYHTERVAHFMGCTSASSECEERFRSAAAYLQGETFYLDEFDRSIEFLQTLTTHPGHYGYSYVGRVPVDVFEDLRIWDRWYEVNGKKLTWDSDVQGIRHQEHSDFLVFVPD